MAMASTSVAFHYLCSPYSLALPNNSNCNCNNGKTRKQTTFPKKRPSKNPNTKFKSPPFPSPPSLSSSSSAVYGGDAITFTRLPPKDDFFLSPLHSPYESSAEVKLSDSKIIHQKHSATGIDTENDEISSTDEVFEGRSSFDYEKFELYEVNSDYESEDDVVDDDDDYDEDDVFGFKVGGKGVAFDGEEEEKENEKEKGVPAVMRCFDRTKIYVKAGDGGNGVVAFRREKHVPLGGPSGGDGGRGGNVYVEVDDSMNSLLPFRQCVHFRAGRGAHGQGRKQNGAKGEDVVVKVPPGTVVREAGEDGVEGDVLLELLHPGQRALLLPGGRGGRGNASFKSGMNKVPKIAENGEGGLEM